MSKILLSCIYHGQCIRGQSYLRQYRIGYIDHGHSNLFVCNWTWFVVTVPRIRHLQIHQSSNQENGRANGSPAGLLARFAKIQRASHVGLQQGLQKQEATGFLKHSHSSFVFVRILCLFFSGSLEQGTMASRSSTFSSLGTYITNSSPGLIAFVFLIV